MFLHCVSQHRGVVMTGLLEFPTLHSLKCSGGLLCTELPCVCLCCRQSYLTACRRLHVSDVSLVSGDLTGKKIVKKTNFGLA